MLICKDGGCPKNKSVCCRECDERKGCILMCEDRPERCECSEDVPAELVPIEQKYPNLLKKMKDLMVQKKMVEAQEQDFKIKLKDAMEQFNIKKIDNEYFTATYVAETTKTNVDTTKLKKELPEIAEKYQKISKVSSSVRLKVK